MTYNLKLNCDGSSLHNPGPSGAGVLIIEGSRPIVELSVFLGNKTNNEAEMLAVFYGVKFCLDNLILEPSKTRIEIFTDSQLTINLIKDLWMTKIQRLKKQKSRVTGLLDKIYLWTIHYRHWLDSEPPHQLAQRASHTQRDYLNWIERKK